MNHEVEEIQAIVIQFGSSVTKGGFAADFVPRFVFPTVIGQAKYEKGMAKEFKNIYVGDEAIDKRGVLELTYPIFRGVVTNFEHIEKVFHYVFYNELTVNPEEHPVMITEPLLNPKANRERLVQLMFETFNVPACAVENSAKLTFFGSGASSGTVLQMGAGCSYTLPIYEGQIIYHAAERVNVGGNDVTEYLQRLLRGKGYSLTTSAEFEVIRDIKEKLCFVARNYEQALVDAKYSSIYEKSYELPDGNTITLGNERFRATEVIFKPELYGIEAKGIHEVVLSTMKNCALDIQRDISCIVLGGGNSMFEGIDIRLEEEIKKSKKYHLDFTKVKARPERKYLTWIGGSILGSNSLHSWFTQESYDEEGPEGIHDNSSF